MAKKMFLDAEFTGLHKLSTLISIALVCEDGNEFYAELTDYDELQINKWLQENVMSKLILGGYEFERDYRPNDKTVKVKGDTELVKQTLTSWLEKYKDEGVELWGDVPADDVIHFRSIFGSAWDVPPFVGYIVYDLATALKLCRQNPDVNRAEFVYGSKDKVPTSDLSVHNALYDARLEKEVYAKIFSLLATAGNDSLKEEEAEASTLKEDEGYDPNAAQKFIDSKLNKNQDEKVEEEAVEKQAAEEVAVVEGEQNQKAEETEESGAMQMEALDESETAASKNDIHAGFVEPTQDEVNHGGQEFDSPIG